MQLGGHPVYTRGEEVGFDTREPVEDVARILEGYHALIAARVFDHLTVDPDGRSRRRAGRQHVVRSFAPAAGVRRRAHDAAVPRRTGRQDRCLGGRLQQRGPFARGDLRAARHAPALRVSARFRRRRGRTRAVHAARGRVGRAVDPPGRGRRGAHAVHTDTWVSMGQEAEKQAAPPAVRGLHGRRRDDGLGRRQAVFMHCLPAYRGHRGGHRRDRRSASRWSSSRVTTACTQPGAPSRSSSVCEPTRRRRIHST